MKRLVSLIGAFCVLMLCPSAGQGQEIRLGMSAAFSGAIRGLGIELYRGSMACFKEVNATKGVHGRTIRIVPYDDGYNPVPAFTNTMRLVQKDDVFVLFDYVGTPTVTRMLPLLKEYSNFNMFLFFPFTGAEPQRRYPYAQFVFNLRASYRQEVEALVDYLVADGKRRIAVFYQIDAYGRSGWEGVRFALGKYGLRMVGESTYYRGATYEQSMTEQVEILFDANPDAIVSIGAYAACAAFIRDARDAGLDIPICNVSFVDSENQLKLLKRTGAKRGTDYTKNLINSQVVPSYRDTSLSAVREYRRLMDKWNVMPPADLMDKKYEPHRYSPVSLEGFLNAKMLVEVLTRLGPNPDKKAIPAVVEGIKEYDLGIEIPVTFGPDRHQGLNIVFLTTVRNGKFVPLALADSLSNAALGGKVAPEDATEH